MISQALRPFVLRIVAGAVLSLSLGHRPAYADDKPRVAYVGSEGRDLDSDLQKIFDEAVWKGLRDTQSVQPVAAERLPRTEDDRPCISQACAATSASQSGAQFFLKADLVETVEQGSPSYQVKLMAVQASPYGVVAIHDFEVRNSIPEELAVRTDPQVAVLLNKMIQFLAERALASEPVPSLGTPLFGAPAPGPAAAAPVKWRRWPWLVLSAAGAGAITRGGLLILRQGKGTCAPGVPNNSCGVRYDTAGRGWVAVGIGAAAMTGGLWGFLRPAGERAAIREIALGPGTVVLRGMF